MDNPKFRPDVIYPATPAQAIPCVPELGSFGVQEASFNLQRDRMNTGDSGFAIGAKKVPYNAQRLIEVDRASQNHYHAHLFIP